VPKKDLPSLTPLVDYVYVFSMLSIDIENTLENQFLLSQNVVD